jgi:hypothetical protein
MMVCPVQYDPVYEEERRQRAKQARLEEHETALAARTHKSTVGEKAQAADFGTKLGTRLLANLQLLLTNVHVRYEDAQTDPARPLAVGVTIARLQVETTGADWQPMFVRKPGDTIFKLVALEALAVYWSTSTVQLGSVLSAADLRTAFQALIATADRPAPTYTPPAPAGVAAGVPVRNQYLLRPLTVTCRVRLNTVLTTTPGVPKVDASLAVEGLDVELQRRQYHQAVMMVGGFAAMVKAEPYRPLRPPPGSSPREESRRWWKFAIAAVRSDVHEQRARWTWARLAERRAARTAYVRLYQLTLRERDTKASRLELAQLERALSFEDIRLYRHIARTLVHRDKLAKKQQGKGKPTPVPTPAPTPAGKAAAPTPTLAPAAPAAPAAAATAAPEPEAKKKSTMPAWLEKLTHRSSPKKTSTPAAPTTGPGPNVEGATAAPAPVPVPGPVPTPVPTPTPVAAATGVPVALDIEEEVVATAPFPPTYEWLKLVVEVRRVSLSLRSDHAVAARASTDAGTLSTSTPPAAVLATTAAAPVYGRVLHMTLDGISLTLAQRPVAMDLALRLQAMHLLGPTSVFVAPKGSGASGADSTLPPLLEMTLAHAPLDGRADEVVSVTLQPLEVQYSRTTVDALLAFATPPADALALSFLQQTLGHRMHAFQQLSRASLEYLVSQHKASRPPRGPCLRPVLE